MGIIKAVNLVFDYIRRDEQENVESVNRALDHVNIDIKEGDFVAILGHNGSGKSTFAKHVNGLLLPEEGTVWVSDMDTSKEQNLWHVRRAAGMVFQNPDNQIIGNVVEEDVGFGPENIGVPTEEIWERVDKSLEAVHMTAYRLKSPNKLSGGQKQRIALARALAKQPEILILDDTTSAVDLETEKQLRKNLQELPYPCTKIIVAQRISAVRSADQILVLQDGRIAQRGTHEQLAACEGYYRDICLLQGVQGMPDAPAANAPAKEVR